MINPAIKQKKSFESLIVAAFALVLLTTIIFVTGSRDLSVGTDTIAYLEIFRIIAAGYETRFEYGFVGIVKFISYFTLSPFIYFSVFTLIVLASYILLYFTIIDWRWGERENSDLFLILGLLLSSSWFVVAVINGLRQGMSLPWVYLSLFLLIRKKYFYSGISFLISAGFHLSVFSLIPFFILLILKRIWLFSLFFLAAIFYPLGINENIIRLVSSLLGVPVYEFIASYGIESGLWVGFQLDLYVYSVFWLILFLCLEGFIKDKYIEKWQVLVNMYGVLLLPFFVLGFGGFSNRFGYIAWFFLPACCAAFIIWSKFSVRIKFFMGFAWFCFGVFYFFSYFI